MCTMQRMIRYGPAASERTLLTTAMSGPAMQRLDLSQLQLVIFSLSYYIASAFMARTFKIYRFAQLATACKVLLLADPVPRCRQPAAHQP